MRTTLRDMVISFLGFHFGFAGFRVAVRWLAVFLGGFATGLGFGLGGFGFGAGAGDLMGLGSFGAGSGVGRGVGRGVGGVAVVRVDEDVEAGATRVTRIASIFGFLRSFARKKPADSAKSNAK